MAHSIYSLSQSADSLNALLFPDTTLVAGDHRETKQTKPLLS